ncbi:hypothetical protein B7463_g5658, partial [Scytalidium lignicola]
MAESGDSPESSKNALKKAAKAAEKARIKAEKAAKELQLRQHEQDVQDPAANNYGDSPNTLAHDLSFPWVKLSHDIEKWEDQSCAFRVVVENARIQSAKLAFLTLSQSLESIQMVVAEDPGLISRPMIRFAGSIPPQSVCTVYATIRRTKEIVKSTTIQHFELHAHKIFIISKAQMQLPLQPADSERPLPQEEKVDPDDQDNQVPRLLLLEVKTTLADQDNQVARPLVSLNTRLNNRVLDLRSRVNHCIYIIKDGVDSLFQEFLRSQGFIRIHTPKIIGAASEGGSNVFSLNYFNRTCYLAQSPQLYKQMAIQGRFPRVMEIGPVFRAENSQTARHLTEFTGLDMEMEILADYHEVVDMLEQLMLFIFNGLATRYAKETELVRNVYTTVESFKLPKVGHVPRIEFSEGIRMLREAGEVLGDDDDLTTPQERKLGQLILEKYNSDFYTLDHFPAAVRPFYTQPSAHDARISNSYDMFVRGQEILSGAQRIHNYDLLVSRIKDLGMDPDADGLRDYVEGFRYGCAPHGGGGLGLERIVQFYLGLPNIRLASLFPRDPGRVMP